MRKILLILTLCLVCPKDSPSFQNPDTEPLREEQGNTKKRKCSPSVAKTTDNDDKATAAEEPASHPSAPVIPDVQTAKAAVRKEPKKRRRSTAEREKTTEKTTRKATKKSVKDKKTSELKGSVL